MIDDLINNTSSWLRADGPHPDIVISSRVRLARNLSGLSFSHMDNEGDMKKVVELVLDSISKSDLLKNYHRINIDQLSNIDKLFLVEKRLISPEQTRGTNKYAAVNQDESVSIMINEEDHIRLQVVLSGLQLGKAWETADSVDNDLEKNLSYAFSEEWGYLTSCLTNTGTGLRASVMLHLAGLVITKQINKILQAVSQLGLAIRGIYGEGTEALGNIFQISNQVTLGGKETDIISNISRLSEQLVEHEKSARETLLNDSRDYIEDKIYRAYGIFKNARIISTIETIELLSDIRLGLAMGILKDLSLYQLNKLFIITQPAYLQMLEGHEINSKLRDIKRADIIRQTLAGAE